MGVHGLIDAVCHFMKRTSNYSITLSPHPPPNPRLLVLAKQTDQIECQCVKGTVEGFGGRRVFSLHGLTFSSVFPPKSSCGVQMETDDKSVTHISLFVCFFSLCLCISTHPRPGPPPEVHACVLTQMNTFRPHACKSKYSHTPSPCAFVFGNN